MSSNKRIHVDVRQLTDEEVLVLGVKIVPTSMIPVIWRQKTGKEYSRSSPLKAKRIKPMGQHKGKLYYWKDEVEKEAIPTNRGRRKKNAENINFVDATKNDSEIS